MNKKRPLWLNNWFNKTIDDSGFVVERIPFSASSEWRFIEDSLVHNSGRFFTIVGTRHALSNGKVEYRPLIEQREIGTLGFITHDTSAGKQILLQAKIEPGNVGICQLAPTYQATASNAARVHGGAEPAYKKFFDGVEGTLQSEQGSRFLGKLNRNAVVSVPEAIEPTDLHRWTPVSELLRLFDIDNLINTDARSVLVCADWETLVSVPFTSAEDAFTHSLRQSYMTKRATSVKKVNSQLTKLRKRAIPLEKIALHDLPGWKITEKTIEPTKDGPFSVIQIAVTSHDREVTSWDQPIVDSHSNGLADLYCAYIQDVLCFYMPPQAEAGLLHSVELGPSYLEEPGSRVSDYAKRSAHVLASVLQSDEGGRFYQDSTHYRLLQVDQSVVDDTDLRYWLSLGEIKQLLGQGGIFTNEARSLLSLVLRWL